MEGLERLIGRSIGGKVTTSVEMERTAHSKSNAASQMFFQNQIRTTVHCQNWCFAPEIALRLKIYLLG